MRLETHCSCITPVNSLGRLSTSSGPCTPSGPKSQPQLMLLQSTTSNGAHTCFVGGQPHQLPPRPCATSNFAFEVCDKLSIKPSCASIACETAMWHIQTLCAQCRCQEVRLAANAALPVAFHSTSWQLASACQGGIVQIHDLEGAQLPSRHSRSPTNSMATFGGVGSAAGSQYSSFAELTQVLLHNRPPVHSMTGPVCGACSLSATLHYKLSSACLHPATHGKPTCDTAH